MTVLRLIHGAAALVSAACLTVTLWTGLHDRGVALAFGVLVPPVN